jgi:tetratricopeptide (TPR) repeat protein
MSDDSLAALTLLQQDARQARSNPEKTERALRTALQLAPEDFEVRLGAYRFYFYNHRYTDALHHAEALIGHAARRLNIATDWRQVQARDADFSALEFAPGLYLQVLIAWGYCQLRLDHLDLATQALEKCVSLDPTDRFGAASILGHVQTRIAEDDDA